MRLPTLFTVFQVLRGPSPAGDRLDHSARAPIVVAAVLASLLGLAAAPPASADSVRLSLEKNDSIIVIGNTFAERMSMFSYFETLVSALYSEHELKFRNLGWSGDTLSIQPRPLNFGELDEHLAYYRADVILACFGMNESFDGPGGLPAFEQEWEDFLDRMSESRFNGERPPRIAMVSPIAHEPQGGKLPDPRAHNENLKLYTDSMRRIAGKHNLPFADLFTPTMGFAGTAPRLTRNGIHTTSYGDWVTAQILVRSLGLLAQVDDALRIDAAAEQLPLRFQLGAQVPLPAPPDSPGAIPVDLRPRVTVTGLGPGRYSLLVDGQAAATGSASDWANGVRIQSGPTVEMAENLRQTILEKEKQFFYRWRAVNGEYIYGRRKEPFGVINFPDEMKALEASAADLDGKIWSLGRALKNQSYQLVAVSE